MNFRKIASRLVSLTLVTSLILPMVGCNSDKSNIMAEKPSTTYSIKDPVLQIGSPQKLISYRKNLTYDMQFPQTSNQKVDQALSNNILQKVSTFTSENANFIANGANNRKELYSAYQSFAYGENNVSVEMQYLQKDPATKTEKETVKTLVFSNEEIITADKVFRSNKIGVAVSAIKSAFASKEEYKDATKDGQIDSKLPDSIDTLKNFAFSGESVIFFFDKGSVLPESYGVASVSVPKESLEEVFSSSSPAPFKPATTSAKDAVEQGIPIVALTFDDGPMGQNTLTILDELQKYNAHATFFVVGKQAEKYPDILRREIDQDCEIGNHTYSHPFLDRMSSDAIATEINKTNEIVQSATGFTPKMVRAPYSAINQNVKNTIQVSLMLWSVDTEDWKTKNSQSTINEALKEAKDGQVILMHDIQDSTVEAVKTIIPTLVERGFYLATVSEMFEAKGLTMEKGNAYRSAH